MSEYHNNQQKKSIPLKVNGNSNAFNSFYRQLSFHTHSESNYTFSSDTLKKSNSNYSQRRNPLNLDLSDISPQNKLRLAANSIERSERLRKRSEVSLLDKSCDIEDFYDKKKEVPEYKGYKEPRINITSNKDNQLENNIYNKKLRKGCSQPHLKSPPAKSALVTKVKKFPQLKKEKTVEFNEDIDVVEVENWKSYNVDVTKKAEDDNTQTRPRGCSIF